MAGVPSQRQETQPCSRSRAPGTAGALKSGAKAVHASNGPSRPSSSGSALPFLPERSKFNAWNEVHTVGGFWRRPQRIGGCPLVGTDKLQVAGAGTQRRRSNAAASWPSVPAELEIHAFEEEVEAASARWTPFGRTIEDLAHTQEQPSLAVAAVAIEALRRMSEESFARKHRSLLGMLLQFIETVLYMPETPPGTGGGILGEISLGASKLPPPEHENAVLPHEASPAMHTAIGEHAWHLPFFSVKRWQLDRMAQLEARRKHLDNILWRLLRFESVRKQVQAMILEMGAVAKTDPEEDRRKKMKHLKNLGGMETVKGSLAAPKAEQQASKRRQVKTKKEEEEEGENSHESDKDDQGAKNPQGRDEDQSANLDQMKHNRTPKGYAAADRFAKSLAAGRAGKSSLLWLWGLWKVIHVSIRRASRKKGELLQQTTIYDLITPFRYWTFYWILQKIRDRNITYHAFEQERMLLSRDVTNNEKTKKDLVFELRLSNKNSKRLNQKLAQEREAKEVLQQRLIDARPDLVKQILSKILDKIFAEVLPDAMLHRTLIRLCFATRELAVLLTSDDEERVLKLKPLTGEQFLMRWVNYHLIQSKLLASEVLEAFSKNNEAGVEKQVLEWSQRDVEVFGPRCRIVRALPKMTNFIDDVTDGQILSVVFGAVSPANGPINPANLWLLDRRDQAERLQSVCQAFAHLLPAPSRTVMQPGDIHRGDLKVIMPILATLFLNLPKLPKSVHNEGLDYVGASAAAAHRAAMTDAGQDAKKKMKEKQERQVAAALQAAPPLPSGSHRPGTDVALSEVLSGAPQNPGEERERINKQIAAAMIDWLSSAEKSSLPTSPTSPSSSAFDPMAKQLVEQLEMLAGPWAVEEPQDLTQLLVDDESLFDLATLGSHEVLLRWLNHHLCGVTTGDHAALQNLGQLKGSSTILQILRCVATDVLPLHEALEGQIAEARGTASTEAATQNLVLHCAKRCTTYPILTEDGLREEQFDMQAAFLAELMITRPALPLPASSELREHMSVICAAVHEATRISTSGVQGLCLYLQEHRDSFREAVAEMSKYQTVLGKVRKQMKAFSVELLAKRAQGSPCNMAEFTDHIRALGGQQVELVSSERIKALTEREQFRQMRLKGGGRPSPPSEATDDLPLEDLLRRHVKLFRDMFRHYARVSNTLTHGPSSLKAATQTFATRGRRLSGAFGSMAPGMKFNPGDIFLVTLRSLTLVHRDMNLRVLELSPIEIESIYNEVAMQEVLAGRESGGGTQADTGSAEGSDEDDLETATSIQGLSLELFVEAMVVICCRATVPNCPQDAFTRKVTFIIEHHIVPNLGVVREEFVYKLLVDPGLEEVVRKHRKTLRAIYTAYKRRTTAATQQGNEPNKSAKKPAIRRMDSMPVARKALKSELSGNYQHQASSMSSDDFALLMEHAGLNKCITRARIGRIFRGLQKLQEGPPASGIDDVIASDPDSDEDKTSRQFDDPMADNDADAEFQYSMAFEEFIDGLVLATLYKASGKCR
eukprot:TRINITY_DN8674_c0_g1_i2.p1 TRINITY_DN8674_c0_g1~~TRINITY_DN8674_c0_g1_i2.p1  ORF type:complete len:1507 (+),score=316.01 TRINITY_DN8674_c0_g1_i2:48-4568(+)